MSDIRSDATEMLQDSFSEEGVGEHLTEAPDTTESFTSLDPNSIPEELMPYYKSMQADYTRKTQTLAEQRRAIEALEGVDPTMAVQAVQFVDRLQSDPTFALEIHRGLTAALEQSGLMPHEAEQAATQIMQEEVNQNQMQFEQDSYEDPRLQELLEWKEQHEQRDLELQIQNALERQELAIRQSHPDYTDDDVNAIYQLAFAYAGDLNAANQVYQGIRDSFMSRYLEQKSSVPNSPPPATGYADAPQQLTNPNQIHDAATRRLIEAMNR